VGARNGDGREGRDERKGGRGGGREERGVENEDREGFRG
jgi:hypothetical protein